MNRITLGLAGLALTLAANAETFKVDPTHAAVTFAVKHMMVSNARGSFKTFEGTLEYDIASKTLKSIQGSIDTSSIDTNSKGRDKHLKNADFFNVAKFPKMTFKSTSVKKTGDNAFEVTGLLNVLGIDREVVLPVIINGPVKKGENATLIGVECNTVINRQDLGITHSRPAQIANEVKITIEAEAVSE